MARHLPPRYFKLSYLVTAWTQRPEDEHRLLSALLSCFLRHDAIPADLLAGPLAELGLPVADHGRPAAAGGPRVRRRLVGARRRAQAVARRRDRAPTPVGGSPGSAGHAGPPVDGIRWPGRSRRRRPSDGLAAPRNAPRGRPRARPRTASDRRRAGLPVRPGRPGRGAGRALVAHRRRDDPHPDDPFRGLYLSDEAVDRAAAPAAPPPPLPSADRDRDRTGLRRRRAGGRAVRLRQLARAADLTDLDVEFLVAALAPDLDSRFERLYGYLNDDVTRRRATIGLALRAGRGPGRVRRRPGPAGARRPAASTTGLRRPRRRRPARS